MLIKSFFVLFAFMTPFSMSLLLSSPRSPQVNGLQYLLSYKFLPGTKLNMSALQPHVHSMLWFFYSVYLVWSYNNCVLYYNMDKLKKAESYIAVFDECVARQCNGYIYIYMCVEWFLIWIQCSVLSWTSISTKIQNKPWHGHGRCRPNDTGKKRGRRKTRVNHEAKKQEFSLTKLWERS